MAAPRGIELHFPPSAKSTPAAPPASELTDTELCTLAQRARAALNNYTLLASDLCERAWRRCAAARDIPNVVRELHHWQASVLEWNIDVACELLPLALRYARHLPCLRSLELLRLEVGVVPATTMAHAQVELLATLPHLPWLVQLDVSGALLDAHAVMQMCDALRRCAHLARLGLDGVYLDVPAAMAVVALARESPGLRCISAIRTGMDSTIQALLQSAADGREELSVITHADVTAADAAVRRCIAAHKGMDLALALGDLPDPLELISELDLSRCRLSSSIVALTRTFKRLRRLCVLRLDGNALTEPDLDHLAMLLRLTPRLEVLSLSGCAVSRPGDALVHSLSLLTRLTALNLSHCNMTHGGCLDLIPALPSLPRLVLLHLSGNRLQSHHRIRAALPAACLLLVH